MKKILTYFQCKPGPAPKTQVEASILVSQNSISFERIQPPVVKNPVGRPHKVRLVAEDCDETIINSRQNHYQVA